MTGPAEQAQQPYESDLWDRTSIALNSRTAMSPDFDTDAFRDRMIAVDTFEELAPSDQRLLEQLEQEVAAGLSPTLGELRTPVHGSGLTWAQEDAQEAAEDAAAEAKSLPSADDDGWVGL